MAGQFEAHKARHPAFVVTVEEEVLSFFTLSQQLVTSCRECPANMELQVLRMPMLEYDMYSEPHEPHDHTPNVEVTSQR